MGKIKTSQRIFDVVRSVKNEFRLPSIQRSFVWEQQRICKLMDSIMNDYPIGSFLVWSPPTDLAVRTREFMDSYKIGMRLISEEKPIGRYSYLVLDGQQRLQSLYLSFFGHYDGRYLYFKLDSDPGKEADDMRYQFCFLSPTEASSDPHWVRPIEIVELDIKGKREFLKRFSTDSEEVRARVEENLDLFRQQFNMREKILFQEVEEGMDLNDVLEVFVRVNSGGIVLSKSDLVFSTVVLKIPDMEEKFVALVDELNGNGEFDFDTDFLIKASFVVFDKGAKYDVKKLRDKEYIDRLRDGFDQFKAALISTMEFLRSDAKIHCQRFLKSYLALIPILDFIYHQPHQQIPEGQAARLRQYLYMSFFMRFYSYGPDGKLDVIHRQLRENEPSKLPVIEIGRYMSERTGAKYVFTESMLTDLDLILNIIHDGVAEIPQKRGWSLERDHIFPDSVLKEKGIPEEIRNSVGNLRLINKTRNILKRDELPDPNTEFFGSSNPELKSLFLRARTDLTADNFQSFAEKRRELIFSKVRAFLGFD